MTGRLKLAKSVSVVLSTFSVILIAAGSGAHAQSEIIKSQVIGAPPEASNMKLVGSNDLQARSAYQPTIHHQGDRWIAYIGHHGGTDDIPDPVNPMTGKAEPNGTSIVRRHRSRASKISAAHSGAGRKIRERRCADGSRL